MDLIFQVRRCIEWHKMIVPGDSILVGVSGGPDSVALLHILNTLKNEYGINLYAGHLNHMFRGEEAEADARFVQDLTREWGIPLISEKINVPEYLKKNRLSPHEGAREVRYRFFENAAEKTGASRVALGHHADDQAETVLINLIRGAGIAGLGGIPPVREDMYIRPLMYARRFQIEDYCGKLGLPFRTDSSNLKTVYTRNRVRLELLPLLEKNYNPAVVKSLNRLAEIARDEDRYIEEKAREAFDHVLERREKGKVVFSLDRMGHYPAALKRRVVKMGVRMVAGFAVSPGYDHVDRILEMAEDIGGRGKTELPGGVLAVIRYRLLEIIKDYSGFSVPYYQYSLRVPGATPVPEAGRVIVTGLLDASGAGDPSLFCREEALVDWEKIYGPLLVRRRKDGDVFTPLGMDGKVKLKKFFIDCKVPREERDTIPIVTCGNDIVWVAGFRPSQKFRVSAGTKKCLHIKLT